MRRLRQSTMGVPPPVGAAAAPAGSQQGSGSDTTATLVGCVVGIGGFCIISTGVRSLHVRDAMSQQ